MKKKFFGIICFLYLGMIYFLWFSGSLKNYLAPNMQVYLKLSTILFFFLGVSSFCGRKEKHSIVWSDLILILPLVMLFLAGNGKLSMDFAQNRSSNIQEVEIVEPEEVPVEEEITYDFSNPDFEIVDANFLDVATYFTFPKALEQYEGKTIVVRGFVLEQTKLPKGYFALGRYVITCCAADAEYVGFMAKYDTSKIKPNEWYEIRGVLEQATTSSGTKILSIKVVELESITEEEQYVYPCYSYGDGKCSETKKYQFQY